MEGIPLKMLVENMSKEMSAIQGRITMHGKHNNSQRKKSLWKPLWSRLEAIQKLKPPTTVKVVE